MNTWKQAFWLAKFELKVSAANIFLCWFILSFLGMIYLSSFTGYLEKSYVGFDIFFLFIFPFAPYWLRSKHFQYKEISDHLFASPTLIMQSQLPIPKDVLVRSRLITYLFYFLPFMLTAFPLLYFFNSSVRAAMDGPAYVVFVLLWLSYGLYFGIILPASDAGDYVTFKIMFYNFVIAFAIAIGFILFFHIVLGYGVVAWTITLAKHYALPSILVSVFLIFISWKFWPVHMKKTIKKLDYM